MDILKVISSRSGFEKERKSNSETERKNLCCYTCYAPFDVSQLFTRNNNHISLETLQRIYISGVPERLYYYLQLPLRFKYDIHLRGHRSKTR